MRVVNYLEVEPLKSAPGIGALPPGLVLRKVTGSEDNASFTMRVVEHTPSDTPPHGMHSHPWEHQMFVVSGQGVAIGEKGEISLKAGDVIFIPADEPHTLAPRGDTPFLFVDCVSTV